VHKHLKIVVPVAQVSAVVCMLGWEKMAHAERTLSFYVLPARHLLFSLNFPLVIIWSIITNCLIWVGGFLPSLRQLGRAPGTVWMAVTAFALVSSIALFWYFVVAEIQMRSRGKSFMNFSSGILQFIKVAIFVFCGIAALFYVYTETLRPFHHGLARYGLWPVEIALSALLLAGWAAVFIGLSIVDSRKLTLNRKT